MNPPLTPGLSLLQRKKILKTRLEAKSLYKSNVIRDSKKLLTSQLGSNINTNYTAIGRPSQVENEEQLAFLNHLHDTIIKVDIGETKKVVKKDKTQPKLKSFLRPPEANCIKKSGL